MKGYFFLLVLFFLSACTLKSSPRSTFQTINDFWAQRANQETIRQALGPNFNTVEDGIVYQDSSSNLPSSGHFFNENGELVEQFLMLGFKELQKFKEDVSCEWNESKETRTYGDVIHQIELGHCQKFNLHYEYRPSLKAYEFRWKR